MLVELTDKAISGSKKSEEMISKPVLSTTQFVENVTKLKNYFDQIDDFKQQIVLEAKEERKLFEEASKNLDGLKVMNKKTQEEFAWELSK